MKSIQLYSLACALCVWAWATTSQAQLSSYATSAVDVSGVTGAASESLGVPDYRFINDSGLGFGGTNTDVFDVGESVELGFPYPLRNIAGQHDVILSAFVGGLGATDNATVQVEASSDGINYTIVGTFDTEEARDRMQDRQENDFEGVKHFFIEFGAEDNVVSIRLTNLAGTSEGLRLDAVEGLHPFVDSAHAFEVRFDRWRPDFHNHFFVRIKNLSDAGGVAIREFRMERAMDPPLATLEETETPLFGEFGDMICVENCIGNAEPPIDFSRHAWSLDGIVEAPPGVGLNPGWQVAHPRNRGGDTDNVDYLSGMTFRVTFVDGLVHEFTYDDDVIKVIGSLYQKYLYYDPNPVESWNRPTDYYEFIDDGMVVEPVPMLSAPAHWLLVAAAAFLGVYWMRSREARRSA